MLRKSDVWGAAQNQYRRQISGPAERLHYFVVGANEIRWAFEVFFCFEGISFFSFVSRAFTFEGLRGLVYQG